MRRVVVVGSGIAGLTAALSAAEAGHDVTVVTKGALAESNTWHAQGGIAAAVFPDDSPAAHAADTFAAGAGLGDPPAIAVLTEEGPDRVRQLIARGVAFDRHGDALDRGLEGAHGIARILHVGGDATGAGIEDALVARVRATAVRIVEHAFLCDVTLADGRATGIRILDAAGRLEDLPADAVLLATGGAGRLYPRTTNPAVATGDGMAAAMRAGAELADLEFVQFHPTVLADTGLLVSEAVRGEGAVLRDASGERFLLAEHPQAELAPRDVVARSIARRMRETGEPVFLDATALGAELATRFPTIDAAVRAAGYDWTCEPIPVAPAAHYVMGGVVTDLDGRTSVPGLYAVGEVARTGVHGANRLASNSLLEGLVFAERTVRALDDEGPWPVPASARPDPEPVTSVHPARAEVQELLWSACGLERDGSTLATAGDILAHWSLPTPATVQEREDANLLALARVVVAAATARTTSAGAHFRTDAPASASPSTSARTLTPIEAAA